MSIRRYGALDSTPTKKWPAELDDRQIFALVFDLTPDAGFDDFTREALSRFRASGEVTPDWQAMWGGVKWKLERVPLERLRVDFDYAFDKDRMREYAGRETEPPPIVLGIGGHILDGQHRAVALRKRGERTAFVYQPIVAAGATGPLRHMVGNLCDSVAYCGEFFVDFQETRAKATDDASRVTCDACKKRALEFHLERPNPLADFLLGRAWRRPHRYTDED